MAARKKAHASRPRTRPGRARSPSRSRPRSVTELALTLPTTQGKSLDLSYWDLWFALVAVRMHDGDLDRLAERIKEREGLLSTTGTRSSGSGATSVT